MEHIVSNLLHAFGNDHRGQRIAVTESITKLKENEQHLFEQQGKDKQGKKYADRYIKNADIQDSTKYVMKTDQENAQTQIEQVGQQLDNQQTQANNAQNMQNTATTQITTDNQNLGVAPVTNVNKSEPNDSLNQNVNNFVLQQMQRSR